ncbi:cobalt transport protein ATP-binding subunit [Sporomusaceae bacterium BoRhaA]|uniref:energy-coupling factor ABC transporter ATP-binding protein n=1 Tax=Pelorhabdus rhamnosifermentans TaxID=2772457 RepID=UPI001C0631E0|nr:ABC transporter ATP-binding protein [Pelorhabdus rhamnosifermentans]MBU2700046.1 cobalt transport protein ATP-binding subunit [Pelorhabdus rhamnosifermentans]
MEKLLPIIKVEDLKFAYGKSEVLVLKGISLEINQGDFIAILGQNGSGKSTLVRHFNGLLQPTSGRVLIKGMNTRSTPVSKLAATVGYVFQNPDHQIFCASVWEEITFGPKNLGLPKDTIEANAKEAIKIMELEGKEQRHPHSLSRGERQRLAIATVLAIKPDVIILDEPTGGQDKSRTEKLMKLLQELNAKGHTIIIITHDIELAAEYAKRILVTFDGTLLLDGDPRAVFLEKEKLHQTFLKVPDIFAFSFGLGMARPALSPEEFVEEFKRSTGA